VRPRPRFVERPATLPAGVPTAAYTARIVKLSDLLPDAHVLVPLQSRTKLDIIDELLAVLPIASDAARAATRQAVLAREAELTTGIGRGVAIPHGRTDAIEGHLCAFGVSPSPVDFEAIDSEPCGVFFLCVSNPGDVVVHLRVLSQMCRVLNHEDSRLALAQAACGQDVRDVFLADEERHPARVGGAVHASR